MVKSHSNIAGGVATQQIRQLQFVGNLPSEYLSASTFGGADPIEPDNSWNNS